MCFNKEERITKLKIFEDKWKKTGAKFSKNSQWYNLEITTQEIKSLANGGNELKRSMEFIQNDLQERVNNVKEYV